MNHHLNAFRFFNESTEKEFIENNLSRAFALCLLTNGFFLSEYIKRIVSPQDYEYLFSSLSADSKCSIDIQVDTGSIEKENYKTVYAVAMTADRGLSLEDFFTQAVSTGKRNFTDITIAIKDVLIVIEVKRSCENCKAQLFNQIVPFLDGHAKNEVAITPVIFSWQDVVKLLERVRNVQQLSASPLILINDFLQLSEVRYPEWFEPKPFHTIPFLVQGTNTNQSQLKKRMKQALVGMGECYPLLQYDRLGLSVPFGWASEVIPYFTYNESKRSQVVEFCIWPGNTKQQGYSVFNKPATWTDKSTLAIDGQEYPLSIRYQVKLSHFYRYVSEIDYSEDDCQIPLHTPENFHDFSGKWNSDRWKKLEDFFDSHFKASFDWREQSGWKQNFTDTDRTYLTMSLGYEVTLEIPFSKLKSLDKKESDVVKVSEFVLKIVSAFEHLLD